MADWNPEIDNSITISEGISLLLPTLNASVFDSIIITEDIADNLVCNLSLSETLSITEDIARNLVCNLSLSDTVTITDTEEELLPTLNISISDTITIAEGLTNSIPILYLAISDTITINEGLTNCIPILYEFLGDSITIAEDDSELIPILYEDTSDDITITEWHEEERRGPLADYYVWIQEWITITDTEEEGLLPLPVYETETVTITEDIDVYIIRVSEYEDVGITEDIALLIPTLLLSISDNVTITDVDEVYEFPLKVHDNVYIRDLFVKAIADADVCHKTDTIAATQLILASATRTAATYNSNAFKVRSALFIRFYFDVTAEAGASTLDITLQTSPDNVKWYDAVEVDQITAIGQYTNTLIEPGIYVRAKCVVGGTSFTFAVKMTKHMPVRRFERRRSRGRRRLVRT